MSDREQEEVKDELKRLRFDVNNQAELIQELFDSIKK